MSSRWTQFFFKASIWIAAEIILNLLGLDNLADYSEFVFHQHEMLLSDRAPIQLTL
jgi:hypothetical protein